MFAHHEKVRAGFLLAAMTIAASPVMAVNVATLPGTTVAGAASFNTLPLINNGDLTDSVGASAFWVPPAGKQGMGYDFGGFTVLDDFRIVQHSAAGGGGLRQRISSVRVHSSQGSQIITGIPDTDDVTLNLGGINTSFLFIEPLTQHAGAPDTQVGVREIQTNSASGVVTAVANHSVGAAVSVVGPGWNNGAASDLNNDIMHIGPGLNNIGTSIFNAGIPNASIVYDLGTSKETQTLGLVQQGGSGTRRMVQDVRIDFSDDNFTTVSDTRTVRLDNNVAYQQANFAAADGRFVRITPLSQYTNGGDGNIGFTEVQLLGAHSNSVDLNLKAAIGGSYNNTQFGGGPGILDNNSATVGYIGDTFPPGAGTDDGGQFGVQLRGKAMVSALSITQDTSASRHRLQDITVHVSPTQSFNFTLADTYDRQVINLPFAVNSSYLLVTANSHYTSGSNDPNVGIVEMEVFGSPLTEDRNVNAGRTAITAGALGGFDFPVRITDGVIHTNSNSIDNSTFFTRNAGQDSVTVNYDQHFYIESIGLGFAVDTTPVGVRDMPRFVTLEFEGGSYEILLAGDMLQYGRYELPGVINTNFLRLLFPDGSVAGNWFIHGDGNYGLTEFEAFAIHIPEPTSIGLLSLAVLALGRRRARAC